MVTRVLLTLVKAGVIRPLGPRGLLVTTSTARFEARQRIGV